MKDITPNSCRLYEKWNDGEQMSRAAYAALIGRSMFVPCMRGNHYETFRMYEALESGSVPIYVRTQGDDAYWNWLKSHIPLANMDSWTSAAKYLRHFMSNQEHAAKYQNGIVKAWIKWKEELKAKLRAII